MDPKSKRGHRDAAAHSSLQYLWVFSAGFFGALLAGAAFPIAGWMTGGSVKSLSDVTFRPETNTWSLWFLILAFVVLFLYL
jgi:ATP-binding cassette subfamily B (MDR/TAP) protein 1